MSPSAQGDGSDPAPPDPPPDPEPSVAVRIVVSLSCGPGGDERYVSGLKTISSTIAPSSRCWTRTVCVPGAPHPLSDQPQPVSLVSEEPSCSTTSAELVVPIRIVASPVLVTESLNCTCTESLPSELPCARSRTHRWYAVPL